MFIIVPYSVALRLNKPPYVTYLVGLICIFVFYLQQTSSLSFTRDLMYYPNTLNPITMLTSSVSHGDWLHILGNLLFFYAFAPTVETIIDNKRQYFLILIAISIITSLAYSLSVFFNDDYPIPTLGLSGVVTGTIGLSAYLYPRARIRVFVWFITIFKNFFIPAWVLAVWYIGWDIWKILTTDDYGGINLISHVSGGVSGYLIGLFFLRGRRKAIQEELNEEMEFMRAQRSISHFAFDYKGGRQIAENRINQEKAKIAYADYIDKLLLLIRGNQDSQAVLLILKDYEVRSASVEIYEELFSTIKEWGPSRALFCTGRLLIHLLIKQQKYAKALSYTEQCLQITDKFVIASSDYILLLGKVAKEHHQYTLAYKIVRDATNRYGRVKGLEPCAIMEIELLAQHLNRIPEAKLRITQMLSFAESSFKKELIKLNEVL